eukprot:m.224727 g.224727  ORF g.224727 m.224727 type:complete len:53 (-) comp54202_c0_seq13:22-180(-)
MISSRDLSEDSFLLSRLSEMVPSFSLLIVWHLGACRISEDSDGRFLGSLVQE